MVLKTLFIQTGSFPLVFRNPYWNHDLHVFIIFYNMLPDSYAIANMTFLHS